LAIGEDADLGVARAWSIFRSAGTAERNVSFATTNILAGMPDLMELLAVPSNRESF
jgi:hypothetical protein